MHIVMSVSIHKTSLDRNARGDRGIIIISICGYADRFVRVDFWYYYYYTVAPGTSKIGRQKPYKGIGSVLYKRNNNHAQSSC